nr:perlucin isoform X3 [Crassostrea gigas]
MKFLVALILLELYSSIEGCEVGWVQFRTKCYMFSHTAASWAEAESICNAFHSILAEPRSHEESMFLISHSVNQGCDIGWIRHHTKCYMFSNTTATWAEAESICNAFHSILAEPRSHDESVFLISQSENEVGHFWIGISDIIKEDRWVYSSDLQPVRVTDFSPGQPNEYTSANCVALRKIFHGYWGDLPCSEHFNFICETKEKSNGDVLG